MLPICHTVRRVVGASPNLMATTQATWIHRLVDILLLLFYHPWHCNKTLAKQNNVLYDYGVSTAFRAFSTLRAKAPWGASLETPLLPTLRFTLGCRHLVLPEKCSIILSFQSHGYLLFALAY